MEHPVCAHLGAFQLLSGRDRELIVALSAGRVREVASRHDVIRRGEPPFSIVLVLEGWACRYRRLDDGRRQILSIALPGDLLDRAAFLLREMDHSVGAITRLRLSEVTPDAMMEVTGESPEIARAMWCEEMAQLSMQREWTVNLGQRSSYERIAHLFCELYHRLDALGALKDHSFDLPLTQTDIADAAGLTPVHVNRMLQELRREGLIELKGRMLRLPDPARLERVALFDPGYLHLGRRAAVAGRAVSGGDLAH